MDQPHAMVIGNELWACLRTLAPQRIRPARSVLLRQGDAATHVIVLESGSALITLAGDCGERTLLAVVLSQPRKVNFRTPGKFRQVPSSTAQPQASSGTEIVTGTRGGHHGPA